MKNRNSIQLYLLCLYLLLTGYGSAQQSMNTSLISKWFETGANTENVTVFGDYLYVCDPYFGVRILDISDINNPMQVATYGNTPYGGVNEIEVHDNYAYAGFADGLVILDMSDPTNPTETGYIATPDWALRLEIKDNIAFIAVDLYGVVLVDITDPANPQQISAINPISGFTVDIDVQNNFAYLACKDDGIRIIDISDPNNPQEAGFYDMNINALDVECYGDYLLVGDDEDSLRIFNISDPGNIYETDNIYIKDDGADIEIVDNYAYVAAVYGGLRIINISDPSNITEAGFYEPYPVPFPPSAYGVDIKGNIAFVGFYEDSVRIIRNNLVSSVKSEEPLTVSDFILNQNYPNPFNPSTKISWQSAVGSWQTLKIYDVLGNEVVTLVNEYRPAGSYEVEFDASNFSSALYFYQLKTEKFCETKKMILLR